MNKISRHEKPLVIKDKSGEKTRNPNRIVINQHVIPRKHILKWSTEGKMVKVCEISTGKQKLFAAAKSYFCVMRLWDQWVEVNMLGPNEKNYQKQIRLFEEQKSFTHQEYIMAYYVMLCVRTWVANKERPDYPSSMTDLSYETTKAELEENELEMAGGVHIVKATLDEGSQHMARQVVKLTMSQAFIKWCSVLEGQKWIYFHSEEEAFILPDSLHNNFHRKLHILPVCPKYVLIAEATYNNLEVNGNLEVDFINKSFIENSIKYYVYK